MNDLPVFELEKNYIDEIILLMGKKYDFDVSAFDRCFVGKSLDRRKNALGIHEILAYTNYLKANKAEAKTLFESLTITYTMFFRDSMTFAFLEQTVLPTLLSQNKEGNELRVWSAGCSTGQEAYSVAILLADMLATNGNHTHFRIFATDGSEAVLDVAKKGIYDADAVQNIRLKQLSRHYKKAGNFYAVNSDIKQTISFLKYDLLDSVSSNPPDSIYGDFDLIVCSNLLIYYSPESQQFIVDKLIKSLSLTGVLVTGEAERGLMERFSGLPPLASQVPIFKRNSVDFSMHPLGRNTQ